MNAKELNFAYKVRHLLNENLDNLPASTTEKLASARKTALARKRPEAPALAFEHRLAGHFGRFFSEPLSWLGRVSLAIPVLVLVTGLIGIYHNEKQQRIADTAEIDAMVLSDELPLTAYLDNGFNAYLAKRAE